MEDGKQEILWGLRIIILSYVLATVWYAYEAVYGTALHIVVDTLAILISAFLAWGLAKRINWVRILVIVLDAIMVGIGFLAMLVLVLLFLRGTLNSFDAADILPPSSRGDLIFGIFLFAFRLWELLYLRTPRVKLQFQKSKVSASAVPAGQEDQIGGAAFTSKDTAKKLFGGMSVDKTKTIASMIIAACLITGLGYYYYISSMPESKKIEREIDKLFDTKDDDRTLKYHILRYRQARAFNNENRPDSAIIMLTSAIKGYREDAIVKYTFFAIVQPFSLNYEMEAMCFEELARSFELKGDLKSRDKALDKSKHAKETANKLTRIEDKKELKGLVLTEEAQAKAEYKARFYRYAAPLFESNGDAGRRDYALMKSRKFSQKANEISTEMYKSWKRKEQTELLK